MSDKKLLITGGCGFIGSSLIDLLSRNTSYKLRVIDNLSLGSRQAIANYDVELHEADILDNSAMAAALDDIDAVVHLAAHTRVIESIDTPEFNFNTNVIGTFNLLMACKERNIFDIVIASTGGAILGEAVPPIHEEMVANPMSPYGASKLSAEAYSSAFNHSYGMNISSLRFSNVYGPRSYHKGSVVAHFFKEIMRGRDITVYGDGTQTRDFVYIDDLCNGIILALNQAKPGIYQLGSGKPTNINQLIQLMRSIIDNTHKFSVLYEPARPGEVVHTWTNITKATNNLGYKPTTKLSEGLKLTWEWFLKNY